MTRAHVLNNRISSPTLRDKRVRVWEWQPGTGYVEAYFSPLMGHKYGVTSVKVSPQSTMLATSSIDGTTLLWNLRVSFKKVLKIQ